MKWPNFFEELQRRNVCRVAVAYAVVAWLLIQVATQVFPFLQIPDWCIRLVIIICALGFPIALVLAWIFELTPEGLKRTEEAAPEDSKPHKFGRKLDFIIIGVLSRNSARKNRGESAQFLRRAEAAQCLQDCRHE